MKFLPLLATALLASTVYAQEPKPLAASQIPLKADAPKLFAPRGWKIEEVIFGKLDRDAITDGALVLVEDKPAKDADGYATERQRALVLILKTGKGWTRAGFSGSLLMGTRDGGAFYGVVETPVDVKIKNRVLNVSQESGSREMTHTIHKFRYQAAQKGFFLIGSEVDERDRLTADVVVTSTNYLTGVRVVKTFKGESDKAKTKRSKVSRKLRPLSSFNKEEARYSG